MKAKPHPNSELAIARTQLANERTLLSYFRFSLGSLLGGAGIIKFLDHPAYVAIGCAFLSLALLLLVVGIRRYVLIKKIIRDIDPEDWEEMELIRRRKPPGRKKS